MSDYCGWPTDDGSACEHPATEDNGRCWQHCEDAKKGGRPSKFNDERARQAIEAAKEGKSLSGCARAAGVTRHTLNNWASKDPEYETEGGERKQFLPAFMRARAEAESLLTRAPLTRPDEIDSQHARFLLKTSFGYQETERIEIDDAAAEGESDMKELQEMADELF